MLLITDEEVNSSVTVSDCVSAMETAFRDLAEGTATDSPRERMFVGKANDPKLYSLGRQCGALERFNVSALRVMSNKRPEVRGPRDNHFILLFSTETGQLLAIIQGFTLSGLRLGATTAIAAKYLAPKHELEVGVFGTGKMARANFEGVAAVTKIRRAKVFSRSADHRLDFCREMERKLGLSVVPVDDPKIAVTDSDLVLGATNANTPIYDGNWLKEGALAISLRNSDRNKKPREFDDVAIKRSAFVVVCSKHQITYDDQREILDPMDKGFLSWERIYELKDVVSGTFPGRQSVNDIIFYHSNAGNGIQFATVGFKAYEAAKKSGKYRELPDEWFVTDISSWWEQGYHPTP
ncbi:MAG TPA: ornithine cyclodeaminase family protein [Candidatus Binatia bacterium]|jgi:ornithine cyclodeaminase/alanine dehydrogenase-like protein (mu-crystallin family)